MALTTGTRLGPYEIVAGIGAGGMGEVYRARDTRLGREVAVKVLPAALAHDPDRVRRFEQEARAAGALNHPNILTIYDVGAHQGSPYLVCELLEGQTLRERLSGGALGSRKAIDYAQQTALGLAAAHHKGIVHRDLKPENLFVTRDGRVKILDFGLAKLTHPEPAAGSGSQAPTLATDPGVVLGTAGYMSPEQVRGEPADHRCDIFSFGAILHEMLGGSRAFQGASAIETMNAILRQDPPALAGRDLAPALERIVRHCLEKSPDERFQSARDLAFDLGSLSEVGSPVAPTAARPRRGFGARAAVAAVVLVATVGAAAFLAGRRSGERPQAAFRQLTFRQGPIRSARFAPDGHTMVYGAAWDGDPIRLFSTRPQGAESGRMDLPDADILAVSPSGEMAISLGRRFRGQVGTGTLARAMLAGGAPREILEGVQDADWSPDGSNLAVVRRVEGRHQLEFPVGKILYQTVGWISHARVSPSGQQVAFIDHPVFPDDRGSVALVDLAGKTKTLSAGWSSAQGLAWTPPGDEIWYTAAETGNNRAIRAVTPSGAPRLILRAPGILLLQDVFRDGRVLVVLDRTRTGIMFVSGGEARERDLSWLDWSFARDLSADGKTLLFDEEGEGGGPKYGVYVRKTDGSPAVRLGEGIARSLSPDGKWALATLAHTSPAELVLYPTGAGERRSLARPGLNYRSARWFPDGRRILVGADQAGQRERLYVQDLAGGQPRAISPEGFTAGAICSDGRVVVCVDPGGKVLSCPVEAGEPRPIAGLTPGDDPIRWSPDDRFLYAWRPNELPVRIYRVNVASGSREVFKEIVLSEAWKGVRVRPVHVAADGNSYAYGYRRELSDLYLVEGLR